MHDHSQPPPNTHDLNAAMRRQRAAAALLQSVENEIKVHRQTTIREKSLLTTLPPVLVVLEQDAKRAAALGDRDTHTQITTQIEEVRARLARAEAALACAEARTPVLGEQLPGVREELHNATAALCEAQRAIEHAALDADIHTPKVNKPTLHMLIDRRYGVAA